MKKSKIAIALKAFLCRPFVNKIQRGAICRASEYLGVSYGAVLNFVSGVWTPGAEMQEKIKAMISEDISLAPKKTGPRKKKLSPASA